MTSPVFNDQRRQVALEFDDTLTSRFRSVREVVAQGVYQRGLKSVAADLNESPGNLSVMLSENPARKLGVDDLELYIQATGDKTPIHYLIARYLGDEGAARDHALAQVVNMLGDLTGLLQAAGLPTQLAQRAKGRR